MSGPGPFQSAKLWLGTSVGLSKDALHVYVGLSVFLLTALVFRRSLRDWRPLGAVLLAAAFGEALDILERSDRQFSWANWHDIWNTMFWPTAIFLIARFWPKLLKR